MPKMVKMVISLKETRFQLKEITISVITTALSVKVSVSGKGTPLEPSSVRLSGKGPPHDTSSNTAVFTTRKFVRLTSRITTRILPSICSNLGDEKTKWS